MSSESAEAGSSEASVPKPGEILAGKYRIERVLGVGGMGVVLVATHMHLDELVAMKLLHAPLAKDGELVGRFIREGKATIKIRSEHVVRVLDVGLLDTGAPFMVMELLSGRDLDQLLRESGPQSITSTIDLVLQACEALAEAHAQGMVHRDLKPANLYLAERADGSPLLKVLDFGISKVTGVGGADLGMTKTSAVMGSPLYMAPEQMRSMREVDARTDIWALGTIIHQMLTAETPFNATTLPELCANILQDPAPPLRRARPDVPALLEAAVLRCLEKDPKSRFANVAELAATLADYGSPAARVSAERIARVLRSQVIKGGTLIDPAGGPSPLAVSNAIAASSPPPHVERNIGANANANANNANANAGANTNNTMAMPTGPQPQMITTGTSWGQTQPPNNRNAAVIAAIGACVLLTVLVGVGIFVRGRMHDNTATSAAAMATTTSTTPSSMAVAVAPTSNAVGERREDANATAGAAATTPSSSSSSTSTPVAGATTTATPITTRPIAPDLGQKPPPRSSKSQSSGGLFDDRK